MSGIATAVVGSAVVGAVVSNNASKRAAGAQTKAAQQGIDEQQRQFDAVRALLMPYVNAGTGTSGSLQAQQNLLGLGGADAQQQAIAGIQNSPMFSALAQQGETGILQNASATGGLRGGNVQGALAQFRPNLLNSLINQQYERLGGLTSLSQNAAAGVGNAGMMTGNNITNLYGQQGAAQAGSALAQGQTYANLAGTAGQLAGMYLGGGFGGTAPAVSPTGAGVVSGGSGLRGGFV